MKHGASLEVTNNHPNHLMNLSLIAAGPGGRAGTLILIYRSAELSGRGLLFDLFLPQPDETHMGLQYADNSLISI